MAKSLISSPTSFIGSHGLPSLTRRGLHTLPQRSLISTRVKFSFHRLPPIQPLDSTVDFAAIVSRAESLMYTLADAAVVAVDSTAAAASGDTTTTAQKAGGWFGFISDAMEVVLKDTYVLDEAYTSSNSKPVQDYSGPRRSKRSRRKRAP